MQERLKNYEAKSAELREKTRRLEEEIRELEGSLYHKSITEYRTAVIGRARKTFVKTCRQRDALPPEPETKDEFEQLTNLLSACLTVLKSIDTEEASVCGSVEELKEHLKSRIDEKAEVSGEQAAALLGK